MDTMKKNIIEQLDQIAMQASYAIEARGNLETTGNDGEDFIEVPVWALREMLWKAYERGVADTLD